MFPPRGRIARPAGRVVNLLKTFVQIVFFWGMFLFVIPALLVRAETSLSWPAGRFGGPELWAAAVLLFVLASGLGLWSAFLMAWCGAGTPLPLDAPRELVVAGPYRVIRNPMAAAGLAQGTAVGLWYGSPLVLAYVALGMLLWNFVVRRWEEGELVERFGGRFLLYRRRVRCWRPRLTPWDPKRDHLEVPLAAERTNPPERPVVLYDGGCPFCRKQVARLVRLAGKHAPDVADLNHPDVPVVFPGLRHEALILAMHLVTPDGRVWRGVEAAVRALRPRPVIGWLARLYYLPGIRLAADFAYDRIAARRYRLGAGPECPDGTCRVHREPPTAG